jgi:uncharacterized membrane protein
MPTFQASIGIATSSQSVWRVLAAVSAWPEWLPTVSSVQPLDGHELKLGSRFAIRQPKLQPATWVVTELDPPRRFVWQARSPGLVMLAEHTVEERSPGTAHVTLRFSFDGLLGAPLAMLFRSITERYLSLEADSLKRTVEGGGERSA